MTSFNYQAKDRAGKTVTGVVEADDSRGAAAMIREMGHLPMNISPARSAPSATAVADVAGSVVARYFVYPLWTGVNIKQLAMFYRQLATLLASGMVISEALTSVSSRLGGKLGRIAVEIRDNVARGGKISDTLVRYPHIFNLLQVSLVRAGEAGGMLDGMLERIATYLEYEIAIRRMIGKMTYYPIATIIFAIFMSCVIPHARLIVTGTMQEFFAAVMPGLLRWILIVFGNVVGGKLIFQYRAIRSAWDFFKIQIPFIGSMARKCAMSRFSRALATLYSAGMSMAQAVPIAADACANIALAKNLKKASIAIASGEGITSALARTGAVMPMVLDMVQTGEKTGNMDAMLSKVADYVDGEVDSSLHILGTTLFVVAIVVAGLIVGHIVINFYSGSLNSIMRTGQ